MGADYITAKVAGSWCTFRLRPPLCVVVSVTDMLFYADGYAIALPLDVLGPRRYDLIAGAAVAAGLPVTAFQT
jgi:hypothetical protein